MRLYPLTTGSGSAAHGVLGSVPTGSCHLCHVLPLCSHLSFAFLTVRPLVTNSLQSAFVGFLIVVELPSHVVQPSLHLPSRTLLLLFFNSLLPFSPLWKTPSYSVMGVIVVSCDCYPYLVPI